MKLLVTGAAGFIGTNFVRLVLGEEYAGRYEVAAYDALTYAGNLANLKDCERSGHFHFIKGDIRNPEQVDAALAGVDAVVNFAAESHVDRSILAGADFISTNIDGVRILAEAAVRRHVRRFIQVSTDEVYGSLEPTGLFVEDSPLHPNSPYSCLLYTSPSPRD